MGGQNVRTELKGEQQLLYADMDGAVRIARGVLAIKPVVHFKGDTNHNVGTVEQDKDVFISGSVGPNFAINAGGSVTIDGMVESGATIHAQEDIVVAKGIVGHQTRVVALGSVEAQFVQGGSVVARGDVIIGSHLLNARVRAGGQVVVEESEGGARRQYRWRAGCCLARHRRRRSPRYVVEHRPGSGHRSTDAPIGRGHRVLQNKCHAHFPHSGAEGY